MTPSAPSLRATSSRSAMGSTAMTRATPASRAEWIADKPMGPAPKTSRVWPGAETACLTAVHPWRGCRRRSGPERR